MGQNILSCSLAPELYSMPGDIMYGIVGHVAHAAEGKLDATPKPAHLVAKEGEAGGVICENSRP